MKKLFLLSLLICMTLIFTPNKSNAMGLFYTNADYPVTATGVKVDDLSKLKSGHADAINILWCVEVGDAGIKKAANSAGIKNVSFIDINEKTVFIFFKKITTTVYGE